MHEVLHRAVAGAEVQVLEQSPFILILTLIFFFFAFSIFLKFDLTDPKLLRPHAFKLGKSPYASQARRFRASHSTYLWSLNHISTSFDMSEAPNSGKQIADSNLEALGYAAELSRNRSTWQVVFMCFILASVPYGLSTTMSYSITGGGAPNMIWGWIIVSLIMLCVGSSLAEITSVFPTAGGVYYQTFALSPARCRRVTAWICGWSYVAGNITITLAVNFATALFLVESLNVFKDGSGAGIAENFQEYQKYLIFLAITLVCHAIPAFGNKWLTHIEVCSL